MGMISKVKEVEVEVADITMVVEEVEVVEEVIDRDTLKWIMRVTQGYMRLLLALYCTVQRFSCLSKHGAGGP